MTTHSIVNWFKLAMPVPTEKNRNVQVGCHIEEVAEMFDAMGEKSVADKLDFIGGPLQSHASANDRAILVLCLTCESHAELNSGRIASLRSPSEVTPTRAYSQVGRYTARR